MGGVKRNPSYAGLTEVGEFAIGAPPGASLREKEFICSRELYY